MTGCLGPKQPGCFFMVHLDFVGLFILTGSEQPHSFHGGTVSIQKGLQMKGFVWHMMFYEVFLLAHDFMSENKKDLD